MVHWNYTKTALIVAVAQFAIRLPLTFVVDAKPFVTGGIFWAGISFVVFIVPIAVVMDLVAFLRLVPRNRRGGGPPHR